MALFESVNNYNIGKIGQAGISSKEQGYINEINNTADALASMFTSPTAWTDLINVLSILDKKIDDNFNVNERQKLIAEKIATMIFVEISDAGYIIYYIPETWNDITFNTTELDIRIPEYPDYGRLVLSY